jgi:hypothetical protein
LIFSKSFLLRQCKWIDNVHNDVTLRLISRMPGHVLLSLSHAALVFRYGTVNTETLVLRWSAYWFGAGPTVEGFFDSVCGPPSHMISDINRSLDDFIVLDNRPLIRRVVDSSDVAPRFPLYILIGHCKRRNPLCVGQSAGDHYLIWDRL